MTSSQLLVRSLDPSELIHFRFGVYVGYSTRVRGALDTDTLAAAFETLREAYPVLSTRLVLDDDGGPVIAAAPEPALISEGAGQVADPLFALPDLDGRAAAIHLVRDRDGAVAVTLLTHHAIADGHHSLHLLSELWTYYTAHAAGTPTGAVPHEYPLSLEQLLVQRGLDAGPAPELPDPELFAPFARDRPRVRERVRTRLSVEQTRALLAVGRKHGTTINGLVSAALLATTAQVRGVGIETLHYTYPVDLRRRLTPEIGYPEGTNVLGLAYFAAEPHSDRDLLALADAITTSFRTGLASGALRTPNDELMAVATADGFSQVVVSTNWGVIPPLPTPADLEIEDFVPDLPDSPLLAVAPHIITTYRGRLTVDTKADSDEAARILGAHLRELAGG
ncbi:hypothetical protein F5X71_19265 [Nocardia brasiliensis]|uniref:Phthiocerol/phthiodiolone dimycocerosyl transferase n=1 Tax=Nocardia brasiliensis TaxID=37326 RepID=A0A6G9XTF5_NOCBR|nr:hypothetical protein [Nocardia brasiliensis]QIS04185.1 hypothetical protein F5X71_19265 [Nocardia brasiliensis]